jgi:tight adherence protein C
MIDLTPPEIIVLLIGLGVLVAISGVALFSDLTKSSRMDTRLKGTVLGDTELAQPGTRIDRRLLAPVVRFGLFLVRAGMVTRKTVDELNATLQAAGFKGTSALGLFLGSKVLLLVLLPVVVVFAGQKFLHVHGLMHTVLLVAIGGVVGMLLPEFIAKRMRRRYLATLEAGVADALDMMVICTDAGLALETGIQRVALEMATLNAPLARELNQVSREMQLSADMRGALVSLGNRTGLAVLRRLATTLIQSLEFGTPMTQALRTLAAEMRQEALVKFEERAARLPVLMTLPLIIFILPCVFLIVGGPAVLNVMATLKHMN